MNGNYHWAMMATGRRVR